MNEHLKLVETISGTTSPMGVLGAVCFLSVAAFVAVIVAVAAVHAL